MIRRLPRSTLFPYPPLFLFFFNDTATTEIYTLSLHDALPISNMPSIACLPFSVAADDGLAPWRRNPYRGRNFAAMGQDHRRRQLKTDRKSTRLNSSH